MTTVHAYAANEANGALEPFEYELGAIFICLVSSFKGRAISLASSGKRIREAHITAPFPMHESFVMLGMAKDV